MKTYDDFIAQVGDVPPFPQEIYGKVKFRVTAEKYIFPACFIVPFFIFAALFMSFHKAEQPSLDFLAESEEMLFAYDDSFYSLFDD